MRWTASLSESAEVDRHWVGGKAAGLIRLHRLGCEVPAGFVVTTEAFRRFVAEHGLGAEIRRLVNGLGDPDLRRTTANRIREGFARGELPADVSSEIHRAILELFEGRPSAVAVRSTSVDEDGRYSFAGQLHTTLGALGARAVESAIVRCWASLFSPGAIEYIARFGCRVENVAMAVIVQRIVSASRAGVMMTVDPRTGDRSQLVIEASVGLGLPVVSGEVDPDRFCVDKVTMGIRSRTIGGKHFALELDHRLGKVVRRELPGASAGGACLDDDEVTSIAQLGLDVERALGTPQEIEWAWGRVGSDEGLFALQTRPVTLPAPSSRPRSETSIRTWLRAALSTDLPGGGSVGSVS
jgi:pyruvate,water dikinase